MVVTISCYFVIIVWLDYGSECIDASNIVRGVFMKGRGALGAASADTVPGAGAARRGSAAQPDDTRSPSRALRPY